jgi:membrane fusion protein, heavy metal efflux system
MADTTRIHAPARLSVRARAAVLVAAALLAPLGQSRATPPTGKVTLPVTPAASAPAPATPRPAKPSLGCLISPERVADIGSPVVGVVAEIPVDNGSFVLAGQALVVLRSDVEQAGLQAAQARSAIEADVYAAKANLMLAHQRHARAVELLGEGFVSAQAVEQARAERDVADQKLQQARGQQEVSQQELRVVQAQLGQRTVRSPFRGVVVERFVNAGERVEDKPLLRLAMLDPLRVEIVMPASRWGSVAVNNTLSVVPELPGAGSMPAKVTHVDKIIDAASNTFRVRLSLPNPGNRLPAGARCKVDEPGLSATSLSTRGSL